MVNLKRFKLGVSMSSNVASQREGPVCESIGQLVEIIWFWGPVEIMIQRCLLD